MPKLKIDLEVNNRKVSKETDAHKRLLDFLREDLNLTGTKEGCGAGECGTCSVFVDGKLVKSCLMPVAKATGAKIETIEGLADPGSLTPMQKAFHKTGASQCGYCIPGMVMAATSALRENPKADIEEIKERKHLPLHRIHQDLRSRRTRKGRYRRRHAGRDAERGHRGCFLHRT